VAIFALLVAVPCLTWATGEVVVSAGLSQPFGTSSDFASQGNTFELRWRHWNRGHSAYEIVGGFAENALGGEIQSTIDGYETLVRAKNELAQLQGTSPGQGTVVAEYGTLDMYYLNANFLYRFLRRARISPTVSFGAGAYYWKLPFRIKFYDVPSFGEQRPWLGIGEPNESRVYAFDFEEQVLDYTKSVVSGGLNAAFGLDIRLTRHLNLGGEARAHLIFSSGQGDLERGSDDQPYLDNMTFLYVQGSLIYRF
jgi:hypothetical protein